VKILYVNPVAGLGGGERQLLDHLVSLRAARPDWDLSVLTFEPGPLLAMARDAGARCDVLDVHPAVRSLGESSGVPAALRLGLAATGTAELWHSLAAELRRHRPDVVQTTGMKAHSLLSTVPRTGRLLWLMQDFASRRRVSSLLLRGIAGRVDGVICISQAVRDDLQSFLPTLPAWVVLNGVDVDHFNPAAAARAGDGVVRVGLVATYARWKGQELFLRAAAKVLERVPGEAVQFEVIGGPVYGTAGSQWTVEELRSLAEGLSLGGVVRFVPFVRDPLEAYRRLDVVVHASTKPEPFGRTIAEAMACGKAVIASGEGGAAELVAEGGDGLLFAPRCVESLAGSIGKLVLSSELRAGLGRAARAAAQRRFDRRRLGVETARIYESLPAAAPRPRRSLV
jgi:glycosyltransferase involved in cell wall biosynthesis